MKIAYDIATATIASVMAGNEFAIAAFVHPQLQRMDDKAHTQAASRLATVLGKAMPLWYGVALALILGAAFEHRPLTNGPGLLIALAAVLWTATIVYTIAALVPINNRIARMDQEHPYSGWQIDRARWGRLHRVRVVMLIASVLLLLTGLFTSHPAS